MGISAPLNLPARTPLPTEQERYLDMLLMVREAMHEVWDWYRRDRGAVYFDAVLAHSLCFAAACNFLDGDTEVNGGGRIVSLAGEVWMRYTEDRSAQAAVSETMASFAN